MHAGTSGLLSQYLCRKPSGYSGYKFSRPTVHPDPTHMPAESTIPSQDPGSEFNEDDMRGPQYETQEDCDVNFLIGAPCIAWCGCAAEKVGPLYGYMLHIASSNALCPSGPILSISYCQYFQWLGPILLTSYCTCQYGWISHAGAAAVTCAAADSRSHHQHAEYMEACYRVGIRMHMAHDALSSQQIQLELLCALLLPVGCRRLLHMHPMHVRAAAGMCRCRGEGAPDSPERCPPASQTSLRCT
jgi:hypothetical protein